MRERDLVLNELAQGLRPTEWGLRWFQGLPEEEQSQVLYTLNLHCGQSHPTEAEAAESIRRSGLRPTHTPAVLLALGGAVPRRVEAVAALRPSHERVKAFRLLVQLPAVADARRRAQCRARYGPAPCGHDWHRRGTAVPDHG